MNKPVDIDTQICCIDSITIFIFFFDLFKVNRNLNISI